MELGFSKFQAYKPQPLALRVFKIPENSSDNVCCRVPFHRSRGVQGLYSIAALSSEQHFEKLPKILKGTPTWMFYWEVVKNIPNDYFF